jgi:putative ABC transport system permease protein
VRTIVGVTRNVRHYELESASRIQVYVPFRQTGARFGQSLYLAVAMQDATGSAAIDQKMREALRRVDPDLAATDVAWMSARFDDALEGRRAIARWSTLFGGLSLALALAGVFALTAYAVAQREREIAIRAALGADRPSLMSTVLQRSLRETALGALLGAGLALVLAPLARSLFFGISPFDPRGLGTALLCVIVGTLAAAAIPAFRAARRDPAQVLRSETIRG